MKVANTTLVNSILSSVWMIDASFANNMSPLVVELIKGNQVSFPTEENLDFAIVPSSGRMVNATWGLDEEIEEGTIAVVSIKGAITKNTQFCGPRGTKQLSKLVKDLGDNSKISAIVFDMDTPGGEANFLNTFAETIKGISKPTIASYSGLCCSAGYYIASACDEMYAQENLDVVGSIGTMVTVADFSKAYEKAGINIHEIYADQSTEKNQDYYEALKGNYAPIKEILNEYRDEFVDFVKSSRTGISEKVFKGATYTSRRAKKLGLIDGVKTFEQVIDRANELSANNTENNSGQSAENNTHNMKIKNIANALGMETIEAHDGQVSLSVENMEILNGLLEPKAEEETPAVVEQSISPEEVEAMDRRMRNLENRLATVEGTTATHASQIETIGSATNTDFSVVNKDQDEEQVVESWNDPKNPNNIIVDEAMGTK